MTEYKKIKRRCELLKTPTLRVEIKRMNNNYY